MLQAADIPIHSCVWVPHPGAAPSLQELMGGHLDAICCSVPEVAIPLANDQVRVLAVMSEERMAGFPDLQTAREQGVDWVAVGWRGLALPKGTPKPIVEKLKSTCLEIAESEAFLGFMKKNGFGVKIRVTDEFTDFLESQDQQWKSVVEAAGYNQGLSATGDPGPNALPIFLFLGLAVAVGYECLRGNSPSNNLNTAKDAPTLNLSATSTREQATRVVFLALGMVVYVVAIPWLGFSLSTLVFVTIVTRQLGARRWVAATAGVVLVAVISVLFIYVFEIQLPQGVLNDLLT